MGWVRWLKDLDPASHKAGRPCIRALIFDGSRVQYIEGLLYWLYSGTEEDQDL